MKNFEETIRNIIMTGDSRKEDANSIDDFKNVQEQEVKAILSAVSELVQEIAKDVELSLPIYLDAFRTFIEEGEPCGNNEELTTKLILSEILSYGLEIEKGKA